MREAAGAYEIAQYARYEVSGPDAEAWLDHLVAGRHPVGRPDPARADAEPGRPPDGRPHASRRLDEERFWLTGSYYLQAWHMRWFHQHLPPSGVDGPATSPTTAWGSRYRGRRAREIVAKLTREDLATEAFPFLGVRAMEVGSAQAVVGRISLTGELGYEIVVPRDAIVPCGRELQDAGASAGLRPIGDRAVDSLRLEKGYGIWSAEFRQENTPGDGGAREVRRVRQRRLRRARGGAARP